MAGAGPEPECGVALQLTKVVVGQVHLGGEPRGHGAHREGLGFDGFRIGGEPLVHSHGVFEATLGRIPRIEPREPAVVDEDGVADQALGGRLEIAVPFEIETESGVGALVGGDRGKNLRGVVEDGLVRHETNVITRMSRRRAMPISGGGDGG